MPEYRSIQKEKEGETKKITALETLGAQGLVYVVILGVLFVSFITLMYRYIEKQKNVFLGLKQSVGGVY